MPALIVNLIPKNKHLRLTICINPDRHHSIAREDEADAMISAIILVILTIFLPPVGVYCVAGCGADRTSILSINNLVGTIEHC